MLVPHWCCIPFQSALGWDHQSELAKHGSQIDAAKGFGGKYGVQTDRKDKVSLTIDEQAYTMYVYMYMYMYTYT